MLTVGILALQGDFARHQNVIEKLGHAPLLVRTTKQLEQCDGLIIPGGESTTLINLMKKHDMWHAVKNYGHANPVYGTCAGCILVADSVAEMQQDSLHLIDISVERNAYGRQVDSFIDDIKIQLNGVMDSAEGVFIRAPKIISLGQKVTPLAWRKNDVVLAEQDHILVGTFHPELTEDVRVHEHFINMILKMKHKRT